MSPPVRFHVLNIRLSPLNHFTVPRRVDGRVDLGTAVNVHPVPKAVYRSDFHENTNFCPQRDSNLGPLAQLASELTPIWFLICMIFTFSMQITLVHKY